jgi:predicted MFS family arabinose efflux permease
MLGAVLPVLLPTQTAVYASAVLFGGSFLIVPTSVTAFARKAATPATWTAAIAMLTTGFAVGQCIGPWLSGEVSDRSYGVAGGLLLSGGILGAAAVIALWQPEPRGA